MSEANAGPAVSVHRSEALADGIYAVAMTLLVIELKLPEYGAIHGADEVLSQIIYSLNMFALAVVALLTWRHIHRHPESALMAIPAPTYRGARVRLLGLMLISVVAVGISWVVPTAGNMAFMLMAVIMPLSRRAERATGPAEPHPAPR